MTFFFDCRFIRTDHHDGISRFSSELFSATAAQAITTAIISDVAQLKQLPTGTKYLRVNDPKNPFAELLLPRKLNRAGATVVFSPMQTMGSLGKKYKLILTLHDLIYYKHRRPPEFLAWPIRLAWRLFHLSYTPVRLLLNRADEIVTISDTTKNLITKNSLTRNAVHVVHNASGMDRVLAPLDVPRSKNLVYMGSFMPYKNVELLIRALQDLPDYTLTLCSRITPNRRKALLLGLPESTVSQIHFLNGTSEQEYQRILDDAFALVSASKEEGFGIPIIEAMSRAVPVIVSDIQIFREVADDAGSYFNPEDAKSLATAVKHLESMKTWSEASNKSLERSRDFGWDKSALQLLNVVNHLKE
jgi:glycosyltransferase involved in cell wall biosynthesis